MRKILYSMAYMDNLAYTSSNKCDVWLTYHKCQSIFSEYGFGLEQFATNPSVLQTCINGEGSEVLPAKLKLLGLLLN